MKTLIDFAVWQWTKWKMWQRIYFIAMLAIIVGFIMPGIVGAVLIVIGLTSLVSWLFKWAIWDEVSNAYHEFKKEKADEQQDK